MIHTSIYTISRSRKYRQKNFGSEKTATIGMTIVPFVHIALSSNN